MGRRHKSGSWLRYERATQLVSFAGMLWKRYGSRLVIFLIITLSCLILGENYPFSNFPMYSSFTKDSFVIYLADAAGRPLPTTRFGLLTSNLQKIFSSKRSRLLARLRDEETQTNDIDKTAAFDLLQYLNELPAVRARRGTSLRGVQVRRVNIVWTAGRIRCSGETLAQHP
jgi:hypothetical protein